jgi:actin-like ATPase involved in cell morphogenesis
LYTNEFYLYKTGKKTLKSDKASCFFGNFATNLQLLAPITIFMGLFSFLTQEIAIDLGTANTLIIHNDQVVVDEPSIVAIDRTTNKIIAVGKKAMMMHEKTHENLKTIRPLKDGVIADFNAAEGMLREMF